MYSSIGPELKADIVEVRNCLKCPYFFKCAKENLVRIGSIDMKARKLGENVIMVAEVAICLEIMPNFFLYKECGRGILDSGYATVIYHTHKSQVGIVEQEILGYLADNYYYVGMKTSPVKIELIIPISEWHKINTTYTANRADILEVVDMLNELYDVVYNQGRRIVLWK